MPDIQGPVGVFDSGVGGIYVLSRLVKLLPGERFDFYGDEGHAPYGSRSTGEIQALALEAAQYLLARGAKALVVACNTATGAAIELLRQRLELPIVGVEPAVKPAMEAVSRGPVVVMATPATCASRRMARLMEENPPRGEATALCLPCPGLSVLIEREGPGSPALRHYLEDLFTGVPRPAALVLGCTHYSFLKKDLMELFGDLPLFDGADGAARQAQRLLEKGGLLNLGGPGEVEITTSGSEDDLAQLRRFWALSRSLP